MKNPKSIEQLRSRSEKVYANGKLLDYKLYGDTRKKKNYQYLDKDPYSQVQNFLYKRAIFGLNVFEKNELCTMNQEKKQRILNVHQRAQVELNILKQRVVIATTNKILALFHNSSLVQQLLQDKTVDHTLKNRLSFSDLGIRKEVIVNRLCEAGILPNNFYELK